MEFQLKFDATPAAVSFAEGLRVFGLGLSAYAKMQPPASSIPGVGATKAVHKPADEEPAPTVEKPAPEPARQAAPTVEKPAPEPARQAAPTVEKPAPEPARQAAANRREARQISAEEPAPQGGAAAPAAEQHTHADILTICAALKRDYPKAFTPAAGLQFTRDACKAAGVDSIKPTDPEAVERLYQAVAKMAADFRALQGGAANV